MSKQSIIAVAGLAGVGKTNWINQQLSQVSGSCYYSCPKTDPTPIDSALLVTNFPDLQIVGEQLDQLQIKGANIYIELGFHLSLDTAKSLLSDLNVQKVAIVSPDAVHLDTEWHKWADRVEVGQTISAVEPKDLWRSPLTSQVVDPASLDLFWDELTKGAYGLVQRAKGIFDVADGRCFYFDFVDGHKNRYQELLLPLWLDGRPQRFSGMEIIGVDLDRQSIGDTLGECCLNEEAIAYYQAKTRENMLEPAP